MLVRIVRHNKGGHSSADLVVQPAAERPGLRLGVMLGGGKRDPGREASESLIIWDESWHTDAPAPPGATPGHGPDERARRCSLAGVWSRLHALQDVASGSHFPAEATVTHGAHRGREGGRGDAGRWRALGSSPPPLMPPLAPPGRLASINAIAQMCERARDGEERRSAAFWREGCEVIASAATAEHPRLGRGTWR